MTGNRALVVAADAVVLDEVLRLAAVANCETECVPDLFAARARWKEAPLVLVDEAAVTEDDPVELPRRKGVLVVCKGPPEPGTWQRAFAVGAQQVHSLPDDETAVLKAFAEIVDGPARPGGRVLAVLGGRGGAGASVFAAGVATVAARAGEHPLLIDCDPLGGGLDLLLGAENHGQSRWSDLRVDSGRVLLSALDEALPRRECGAGWFSWLSADGSRPSGDAIAGVVESARRAGRLVVCDLPRHLGDGSAEAAARADLAVVVVPLEHRACSAAKHVVALLRSAGADTRIVAQGPAHTGPTATEAATRIGAPLLAEYRRESRLTRSLARGTYPPPRRRSPLHSAAVAALTALPRQEPTP
ncbi:septum site-determining protein Ssd [Amycolatopsis albispora]|uniref:septum site-determining protein Ssd n=1 Tax=Amycolatopsis albispora TaxID=1804986 RepID=UPI000DE4C7CA|nr:septum site-determining protein Ssd [Amycolatopsis albispora]